MRTAELNAAKSAAGPTGSHLIGELTLKRSAIVVALMLAAYLVGYIPGWLSANGREEEIARLTKINRAHTLKATLAASTLHAAEGRFDESIASAGAFFDGLRLEAAAAGGMPNTTAAREAAADMLARRDEIVAMLARGDAEAARVLTGWYFTLDTIEMTNEGE